MNLLSLFERLFRLSEGGKVGIADPGLSLQVHSFRPLTGCSRWCVNLISLRFIGIIVVCCISLALCCFRYIDHPLAWTQLANPGERSEGCTWFSNFVIVLYTTHYCMEKLCVSHRGIYAGLSRREARETQFEHFKSGELLDFDSEHYKAFWWTWHHFILEPDKGSKCLQVALKMRLPESGEGWTLGSEWRAWLLVGTTRKFKNLEGTVIIFGKEAGVSRSLVKSWF